MFLKPSARGVVTNPPINGVSTVDWNNVHQQIDGFGASSAYNGSWTASQADILFSTNNNISYQSGTYNGIGLSYSAMEQMSHVFFFFFFFF